MSIGCGPPLSGILVAEDAAASTCGADGGSCGGQERNDYPRWLVPLGTLRAPCGRQGPGGGNGCQCSGGSSWGCSGSGSAGGSWAGSSEGIHVLSGWGPMGGPAGWSGCLDSGMGPIGLYGTTGGTVFGGPLAAEPMCPPPPGSGCLDPDTPIALHPSGSRPAGAVQVGDEVGGRHADGQSGHDRVVEVRRSQQPRLRLELEGGTVLFCSTSHQLLAQERGAPRGRTLSAQQLQVGDRLLMADGSSARVEHASRLSDGPVVQILTATSGFAYSGGGVLGPGTPKPAPPPYPPA